MSNNIDARKRSQTYQSIGNEDENLDIQDIIHTINEFNKKKQIEKLFLGEKYAQGRESQKEQMVNIIVNKLLRDK